MELTMSDTYLDWVTGNTRTKWWHDSAEAAELDLGLKRGAIGHKSISYEPGVNQGQAIVGFRDRSGACP
jgi:hypothetical protein